MACIQLQLLSACVKIAAVTVPFEVSDFTCCLTPGPECSNVATETRHVNSSQQQHHSHDQRSTCCTCCPLQAQKCVHATRSSAKLNKHPSSSKFGHSCLHCCTCCLLHAPFRPWSAALLPSRQPHGPCSCVCTGAHCERRSAQPAKQPAGRLPRQQTYSAERWTGSEALPLGTKSDGGGAAAPWELCEWFPEDLVAS
jgi:hypothetical protein